MELRDGSEAGVLREGSGLCPQHREERDEGTKAEERGRQTGIHGSQEIQNAQENHGDSWGGHR